MIKKIEMGPPHRETFAEPTPLGLIGLAVGCAALTPIAFGRSLTPQGLETAAMFCLLFGAGGQLLAGLMGFANRNLYGGTIFTAFAFNWVMNWWALHSLAGGRVPDHAVVLATEVLFLVIFLVLTYGFGFFSKLLFYFLLDIDLMFAAKVAKGVTHTRALDPVIAVLTVLLALISLWIAFAMLINPTAGRQVFRTTGPMFKAPPRKPAFDWSLRRNIFEVLYGHWRGQAFRAMKFADLEREVRARVGGERDLVPELLYLADFGSLVLVLDDKEPSGITAVRLNAAGIDLYEQLVLEKWAA